MVYFLLSQFGSPRRPLYLIITGVPNWIIKTLPTKQRHLSLLLLLPSHTIGPSLIQIIRKHNHYLFTFVPETTCEFNSKNTLYRNYYELNKNITN